MKRSKSSQTYKTTDFRKGLGVMTRKRGKQKEKMKREQEGEVVTKKRNGHVVHIRFIKKSSGHSC